MKDKDFDIIFFGVFEEHSGFNRGFMKTFNIEKTVTTQHPIKVTTQHPIKNFSLINYKLDFAYFHHHHEHSND